MSRIVHSNPRLIPVFDVSGFCNRNFCFSLRENTCSLDFFFPACSPCSWIVTQVLLGCGPEMILLSGDRFLQTPPQCQESSEPVLFWRSRRTFYKSSSQTFSFLLIGQSEIKQNSPKFTKTRIFFLTLPPSPSKKSLKLAICRYQ